LESEHFQMPWPCYQVCSEMNRWSFQQPKHN
jgi:hypothetical protein